MAHDARTRNDIGTIVSALRRVRRRARLVLVAGHAAALLAIILAVIVSLGLADYAIRMPSWLRMGIWLVGAASAVALAWRWIIPAWRFRPTLTDIALRIERSKAGRDAGLPAMLAAAVDFRHESAPESSATRGLREVVQAEAASRFSRLGGATVIHLDGLRRRSAWLVGASVIALAMVVIAPTLSRIGAQRVLMPWTDVSWPTRTEIVDATALAVHPLGSALPLRAVLTRTDQAEGRTTVAARYRLFIDGREEPVRRVLLTGQRRTVEVGAGGESSAASGELYERLIEPVGLGVGASQDPALTAELEYWFETSDNQTRAERIRLVAPPMVKSARAIVTPPGYVGAVASGAVIASGNVDLGSGGDARAVLSPVLAGSRVQLTIDINKPIPAPPDLADAAAVASQAEGMLGDASLGEAVVAWGDGGSVQLDFVATRSMRLPVVVTDAFGLTSPEDVAYAIDVIEDRAATAAVIEPVEDESVLPTAVIGLIGEGRDDAGVAWVAIESQHARPPSGSLGAPPEALAEPVRLAERAVGGMGEEPLLVAEVRFVLELESHGAQAGDEFWITAMAQDTYVLDGVSHVPGRSAVRRLRVLSEDQFITQIRTELAGVRETAKRLDEEQAALETAVPRDGATEANRARQAGITDRLAALEQAVSRLAERTQRNRLEDEAIDDQLAESERALGRAAEQSREASQGMNTGRAPDPTLTPEEQREVEAAQEQVRQSLAELIEMLDAGEDSWLARRQLEALIEQQRELMGQTSEMTDRTLGRSEQDLTAAERGAMESIAERQREIAERASQALDDLQQRSQEMQQRDPMTADAMAQAAQRGRQQQVPEQLEQAAEQIEQNQGQSAQQSQQQALEAMEDMLEDLQNAQRSRDETLRRILASVIESLQNLIAVQQRELDALAIAERDNDATGLDAGMIRLHTNTLGVESMVRVGFRELAVLADHVRTASEAQATAIGILRTAPLDAPAARTAEQASLAALEQALAEAQRQQEEATQRDLERQRREMRRAYREALEQQVVLRGETATFVDKDLARRQRVTVRRLGDRQDEIRERLAEVRRMLEEAEAAALFTFAHERLDALSGASARELRLGEATQRVLRDQDSITRILQSLIRALDPERANEDEFRENEQAGGEGEGQSGGGDEALIPPMAELILLREMQMEAADATRDADDSPAADLDALGELQAQLAGHGAELIRRLMEAPPPTGNGGAEP